MRGVVTVRLADRTNVQTVYRDTQLARLIAFFPNPAETSASEDRLYGMWIARATVVLTLVDGSELKLHIDEKYQLWARDGGPDNFVEGDLYAFLHQDLGDIPAPQ